MSLFTKIKDWIFGKEEPAEQAVAPAGETANGDASSKDDTRKPRILISGGSADSKSVAAAVAMIRGAGGEPVVVTDHAALIQQMNGAEQAVAPLIAAVDGVMIMGNDADHDPAKYGQAKDKATHVTANAVRAEFEELLTDKALEGGVPLFGICAGMQGINIHKHQENGGTLHQDLVGLLGDNHHMQGADDQGKVPPYQPVQFVAIKQGSLLADIAGATPGLYTPRPGDMPPDVVMENAFHHQAVDKVHKEFQVAAVSDDGVIAAIEPKPDGKYGGQFVVATQFHPEFGASDLGAKLASAFTGAAKEHAQAKEQELAKDAAHTVPGPAVARLMAQRQQQAAQRL